jgi:hypothetical protein
MPEYVCTGVHGFILSFSSDLSLVAYLYLCKLTMSIIEIDGVARIILFIRPRCGFCMGNRERERIMKSVRYCILVIIGGVHILVCVDDGQR